MGKEQRELSGAMVIFCNLTDVYHTVVYICQKKKKKENKMCSLVSDMQIDVFRGSV